MGTSTAEATWSGPLKDGQGTVRFSDFNGPLTVPWKPADGTNPEELVGAAHAGCYSMMLSRLLSEAGFPPQGISTRAEVHTELQDGCMTIIRIDLSSQATVPGIDADEFQKHATTAKAKCPVSRALTGTAITLNASLG